MANEETTGGTGTEHVEANIIEEGIAPLAGAERWLAQASDRVAERCELYRPPKAVTNEAQRKDATSARTQVRRDVAEIDAERKAVLRDMEDALRRFKANVKDVLSPLTDLDAEYKRLLDEYEAQWKADRVAELAREYEDMAPDLVPLVPFDALLARYGSQRGKVWTNRSTNVEAAKDMIAEAVADIAEGERTIADYADDEDAERMKALYFETLNVATTLAEARREHERRERVRKLEEQRRAREEAAKAAEAARMEAERRAEEEAERQRGEAASLAMGPEPLPEPFEAPEPEPVPADYVPAEAAPERIQYEPPRIIPAPTTHVAPVAPPAPVATEPADAPRAWVVEVKSATRAQMQKLSDALSALGLRGNIRPR